ncbi:MAG: multidrug resistance efflux transporter family protein [Lysinibacillus fusiformis]|jgi:drug/metabolite transporter (DMT)-like permease|uniref:DMT family transporter n=1 Tax=Lysinibacillus TaxID=400634 RepID=UPI0004D35718|nr:MULTISPECIES: multidrug resistance efflux transporter family protein [Lysinibacillus]MDC6269961.1 multidrug resistance efflux transporter family protein [Lysinibacillus sphaericus]AJK89610.1 membrane protein [Lysinibacillus fusiformis]KHK54262.1 membrane protein [Lysinibacillus sp. A1]MCT6816517.1 multidrug resistance efflux transporter family protein [Lysinibacillus fusiformis]MCT6929934.1 multidrug resistance efflux transporter family protein [Lysinibacillus fusiformis]
MKEIAIGIVASLFFAVTFILNHAMEMQGGSWLWSASLRYFFMLPFLLIIVFYRRGFSQLSNEIKAQPTAWLLWSFVGFVLFYAPLTYAAAFGPGWLVSGTWQFTIVAGVLLAPLFMTVIAGKKVRQKIPFVSLLISCVILVGILLIQIPQAQSVSFKSLMLGILPVIVAAFAYPLGNRKMMDVCGGRIDTFQRVLGMTIASMPAWIIMAIYALFTVGLPSTGQLFQSLLVGISSGVIATILFFIATDRVKDHQGKLAAVEATQSTEILFVIIGEVILLGIPFPNSIALAGLGVIIVGMLLHSYYTMILGRKSTTQQTPSS